MSRAPKPRWPKRLLLPSLAALALVSILGALAFERSHPLELPRPTGPFPVGRALYDWKDERGFDPVAPVPGTRRELLVWIWYPAEAGASAIPDDYLPAAMRPALGPPGGPLWLLTRDLSKVRGHSLREPGLSPRQPLYPVVIMRAGASREVANYTTLAEDLASHGYVVVGLDAPYRTHAVAFPDGRVLIRPPQNDPEECGARTADSSSCIDRLLRAWTADTAFVLDRLERLGSGVDPSRFAGRLDLDHIGVFGHSFGGATAAQFCHEDARCKAGIDIDGQPFGSVVREGLGKPFLFLLSDHGEAKDPDTQRIEANIQSIYDSLPPSGRERVMIRGANHFLFSDDGALLKSEGARRILRLIGAIGIDGRRQLQITAWCLRTFFDAYLKGPGESPPRLVTPAFPELQTLN